MQRKCVCAIDAKKILKAIIKVCRARITFFRIAMIEITHFLASKTKSYQVVKHQVHPKMVISQSTVSLLMIVVMISTTNLQDSKELYRNKKN